MNFEKIIKIIIFAAMACAIIAGTCEQPTVQTFAACAESAGEAHV